MRVEFYASIFHVKSRWALVDDEDVAKKMTKFIMLNTLGVSKDSQFRSAAIMHTISASYESQHPPEREKFFDFSLRLMEERWQRLKETIEKSSSFILPKFPLTICQFSGEKSELRPGNLSIDFYYVSSLRMGNFDQVDESSLIDQKIARLRILRNHQF